MKKIFCFSIICLIALSLNAQEFVDLGLPSGTKWKDRNEVDLYYYGAAMAEFGNSLPTYTQFEELKDSCKWEWKDNGYKVTGPNGNSIFLPVSKGLRDCHGDWYELLSGVPMGCYWSSTAMGLERAWILQFNWNGVDMAHKERCIWHYVRLVQNN